MKKRTFLIKDIECESVVEIAKTRKEVFEWMGEYIENMQYDFFDASDDCFAILYKDGTTDYIDEDYDGHKIKRKNIVSIVYNNPCTAIVFGNFEINECGVVTVSEEEIIAKENIIEIQ